MIEENRASIGKRTSRPVDKGQWLRQRVQNVCVCVCVFTYIYDVSPVSICCCHAPLPPMHDNYSAPDSVNNKRDQGSARRRPASVLEQN